MRELLLLLQNEVNSLLIGHRLPALHVVVDATALVRASNHLKCMTVQPVAAASMQIVPIPSRPCYVHDCNYLVMQTITNKSPDVSAVSRRHRCDVVLTQFMLKRRFKYGLISFIEDG